MRIRYLVLIALFTAAATAIVTTESSDVPSTSETSAMTIAMTSVFVDDPARALTFYTEVLGFAEHLFIPEAYLAIVVSPVQPDGTALLLEPNQNPIASRYQRELFEAGIPVIVFGTTDMGAEYERLTERGVVFPNPPNQLEGMIMADFEDTFGNLIRLVQML